MQTASAVQWGKLLSWSEVLTVYVIAASTVGAWRQAFGGALSGPALLWCVGPEASTTSKRLAAFLSERGLPIRWLPLQHRPSWIQEVVHLPWEKTSLAGFLQEVPYLLLDAPESVLHQVHKALQAQDQLKETRFIPSFLRSPLLQTPVRAESAAQLQAWAHLYEELAPDFALVERWLPCLLTSSAV